MSTVHRVLVADDDREMVRLLARSLSRAGYDVDTVHDGAALVARFGEWCPDLVVTDVRMPGAGGLDALAELRSKNLDVPVVVITAFGDTRLHQRAHSLGASAVVDKPFDLAELRGLIGQLIATPQKSGTHPEAQL